MIPKECKRLAEVDFPIAAVSRHAAREKSIRHGHPSTLHLWWARRPLASSRAMLMALLLPDPCDPLCPEDFKTKARTILLNAPGRPVRQDEQPLTDAGLRQALLTFIADFANWDNAASHAFLSTSRDLVGAAHPEETPLVVDPFAGGGSIPLEALRLGCDAFASDINPVACLILKVMLENLPRNGPTSIEELRKATAEIKIQAERELAELYPKDPDGATPIAYLWARTVRCESPNCGAEIPLMRSLWLCRKRRRKWALRPNVVRTDGVPPKVEFEIFSPKTDSEVPDGTVSRAKATCLCCRTVLSPERVRTQIAAQRGGADTVFDGDGSRIGGATMTAVVTRRKGQHGRHYRLPTDADYAAVRLAQRRVENMVAEWVLKGEQGICPVPDEPLPPVGTLGFRVQRYGMSEWGDLFSARQKAALLKLGQLTSNTRHASSETTRLLLALAISRFADDFSSLSRWMDRETPAATFTRQALPILWDFCEIAPLDDASWSYSSSVKWVASSAQAATSNRPGQMQQANATEHPLPDQAAHVWFTDPPYYDAVPYADLSDYFFVWLKRIIGRHPLTRDPFDSANPLSPKTFEAVLDETKKSNGRVKDRQWFEETMTKAFGEGHRLLVEDGIGSVVFAHKTTEGWEALLSGLIRGGWTITGSWPIATERSARPRAHDSAALATSIHLVCRPRSKDAHIGEWAEVLRELPDRVGDWIQRLEGEGVRGADLVFACIGPSLEIYSRYRRVEDPEGREVTLPEYLERIWEVVGREALKQVLGAVEAQARNGAAGALEEDARLTALFLWTVQSTDDTRGDNRTEEQDESSQTGGSGFTLPFDVARRFAQPLGIHMDDWESRIISTKKGIVRLLPVSERNDQLLGKDEGDHLLYEIETSDTSSLQPRLLPEETPWARGSSRLAPSLQAMEPEPAGSRQDQRRLTTLDRVHMAMLFQASGRSAALRTMLQAEQERGPYFMRLANALSALYPSGSSEKRLLDAMLLAASR